MRPRGRRWRQKGYCGVMITAETMRELRARLRETQRSMATRLGVSERTILTWEHNGVPKTNELQVQKFIDEIEGEKEAITEEQLRSISDTRLASEMLRRMGEGGIR